MANFTERPTIGTTSGERTLRGLARAELVKDRLDTRTEACELLVDDLPDEIKINAEVVMDELVAHAGDLPPRQVRVRPREASREPLYRLPDDLEVAEHRVLRLPICEELRATAGRVRHDGTNGVTNMEQVRAVVLHNALASARIRSRR